MGPFAARKGLAGSMNRIAARRMPLRGFAAALSLAVAAGIVAGQVPWMRPRLDGLPVLQGAMSTHVLIVGQEKREALERVRNLKPREAPVAAILPDATVHWAE
mgnify:CR=1 FL=1